MSPADDRAEAPAEPVTAPTSPRRRRNWRAILTIAVGVVAALCLAGTITGYVIYDRATEPDRSTPTVTTSNYLRAVFAVRNETQAGLYSCEARADLTAIESLLSEIEDQERRLSTAISVSWGELVVADGSDSREKLVSTDVRRSATVDGVLQSVTDRWTFQVIDQDGWRVCGATKVP